MKTHARRPVSTHQKRALCILFEEAPHPLEGRTYVQKLMYLFQECADRHWFSFDATDYGPFSDSLYRILDHCIEYDYVHERELTDKDGIVHYHYSAGKHIEDVTGPGGHDDLHDAARAVIDEYPTDDLQALLEALYVDHSEMARNSIY